MFWCAGIRTQSDSCSLERSAVILDGGGLRCTQKPSRRPLPPVERETLPVVPPRCRRRSGRPLFGDDPVPLRNMVQGLLIFHRHAAGIGATFHVVAVPAELDSDPVHSFRERMVESAASRIQHMQKALMQMNRSCTTSSATSRASQGYRSSGRFSKAPEMPPPWRGFEMFDVRPRKKPMRSVLPRRFPCPKRKSGAGQRTSQPSTLIRICSRWRAAST